MRTLAVLSFALMALLFGSAISARAQFGPGLSETRVLDASALRPPAGARVAIVEFDDMECPMCGEVNPTIMAAAAQYRIPWIRHDFIIPGHIWSPIGAVYARWFDQRSKELGYEYRNAVFANQNSIYNPRVLRQFTEKFAAAHHIQLPFAIDPEGKLAAAVQADTDLGRRTGIDHTPTIFVVMASKKGPRYIEVLNPMRDLYRTIDEAMAETRSR
ncbi:MAG: DsbA family protein [Terracidiphilus sp.]